MSISKRNHGVEISLHQQQRNTIDRQKEYCILCKQTPHHPASSPRTEFTPIKKVFAFSCAEIQVSANDQAAAVVSARLMHLRPRAQPRITPRPTTATHTGNLITWRI
jgi:hypothetical protein